MKKTQEIGLATITYDKEGNVREAEFTPTLKVGTNQSEGLLSQFLKLKNVSDVKGLEDNAGLLLGAWFQTLNNIELADRDIHKISTEVLACYKHPDDSYECKIRFNFEEL